MTQERMTRRIRQLEEEKLFAEMQASKELNKCRKTPKQRRSNCIAGTDSRTSTLADRNCGWRRPFVVSRPQRQPQHWSIQTWEHKNAWPEQWPPPTTSIQRQGRCLRILTASARIENSTIPGRQMLHQNTKHIPQYKAELVDETYGNNIKRMPEHSPLDVSESCV